jgi:hypothetical protein
MRPANQCPNCGAAVSWGAKFCGGCGGQLSAPMQAPAQQFTPAQQQGPAIEYQRGPQAIAGRRIIINYTGSGGDLFGRFLLWAILGVLTIGIYYGWAVDHFIRYVIAHTVVEIS